ncbi:integrin beta-1-A-like [Aricia agestis]|uniref:integrin beta-1-A-like n=1 Tax=Aricia agestis TaxID=91739 RepID=UPI001C20BE7D|nr:integrin beta-1-A-like [Aricia agestis]
MDSHMFYIFLLYLFSVEVHSESACPTFLKCSDCITYAYDNCIWCSAKEHVGKRCISKTDVEGSWCTKPVYDPQPDIQITKNDDFKSSDDPASAVQLKPQKISVKVRPGLPVIFPLSYKPAKDYPLDIYYLIDASYTMTKHKDKLQEQGIKIYKELTKLNNNVRLGMGSFIEKPGLPFAIKEHSAAYAYKNNLKLTTDMVKFTEAVGNIEIFGNYDDPEAGFDGLMQAMVCEQVGWREEARRIIVFSTDSNYHSAGDGKFTAAYRPNDLQCHLEDNSYTKALDYDYPSVSQINKVAMENNIKIIFTIVGQSIHHYKPLENEIHGANVIALNSSDVVGMIIKEYHELVRKVLLESELPPHMRLTADPDCTQSNKLCNLQKNSLDMKLTLVVDKCLEKRKEQIKIGINSLKQKLLVDIELDCECECEKKGEGKSKMCNEAGTYQCGVCACDDNRYGPTCQCSGSKDATDTDKYKCNYQNETQPCSGRGTCRCGKCECRPGFSGEWCEFDDGSCARPGGLLCAGHGRCEYARCRCDAGWNTTACRCPEHNRGCVAPHSDEVCSGNGECDCGQCKCLTDGCSGQFCERCNTNSPKLCKQLEDPVLCIKSEERCDEKYKQLLDYEVYKINRDEFDSEVEHINAQRCYKVLKNATIIVFKVNVQTVPPVILIQEELDSPSKALIWIAVGSAIGLVILIGLLTVVIWKYLIDLHDAREYKKFETLAKKDGYDVAENPLYMSPLVDVRNPAYHEN